MIKKEFRLLLHFQTSTYFFAPPTSPPPISSGIFQFCFPLFLNVPHVLVMLCSLNPLLFKRFQILNDFAFCTVMLYDY
ncbi:hypothetical protein L5515_007832 [Caenorhabditis briggsae]|uniref:Uncharacterized protein n=1 Tax=Caenorhabditis briggsae TaxID=6238 RepID=A0AAE9EZI0_CAEBR|nr:hypothetical protein L5515_007832 [Caenorhabditis briggsae]